MAHNLGGHYYWEGVTTQIIVICSDEIIDFLLGRGFVREMSPLNQGPLPAGLVSIKQQAGHSCDP